MSDERQEQLQGAEGRAGYRQTDLVDDELVVLKRRPYWRGGPRQWQKLLTGGDAPERRELELPVDPLPHLSGQALYDYLKQQAEKTRGPLRAREPARPRQPVLAPRAELAPAPPEPADGALEAPGTQPSASMPVASRGADASSRGVAGDGTADAAVAGGPDSGPPGTDEIAADVLESGWPGSDRLASHRRAADGLASDVLAPDRLASDVLAPDRLAVGGPAPDGLTSEGLAAEGLAPDGPSVERHEADGIAPPELPLPDPQVTDPGIPDDGPVLSLAVGLRGAEPHDGLEIDVASADVLFRESMQTPSVDEAEPTALESSAVAECIATASATDLEEGGPADAVGALPRAPEGAAPDAGLQEGGSLEPYEEVLETVSALDDVPILDLPPAPFRRRRRKGGDTWETPSEAEAFDTAGYSEDSEWYWEDISEPALETAAAAAPSQGALPIPDEASEDASDGVLEDVLEPQTRMATLLAAVEAALDAVPLGRSERGGPLPRWMDALVRVTDEIALEAVSGETKGVSQRGDEAVGVDLEPVRAEVLALAGEYGLAGAEARIDDLIARTVRLSSVVDEGRKARLEANRAEESTVKDKRTPGGREGSNTGEVQELLSRALTHSGEAGVRADVRAALHEVVVLGGAGSELPELKLPPGRPARGGMVAQVPELVEAFDDVEDGFDPLAAALEELEQDGAPVVVEAAVEIPLVGSQDVLIEGHIDEIEGGEPDEEEDSLSAALGELEGSLHAVSTLPDGWVQQPSSEDVQISGDVQEILPTLEADAIEPLVEPATAAKPSGAAASARMAPRQGDGVNAWPAADVPLDPFADPRNLASGPPHMGWGRAAGPQAPHPSFQAAPGWTQQHGPPPGGWPARPERSLRGPDREGRAAWRNRPLFDDAPDGDSSRGNADLRRFDWPDTVDLPPMDDLWGGSSPWQDAWPPAVRLSPPPARPVVPAPVPVSDRRSAPRLVGPSGVVYFRCQGRIATGDLGNLSVTGALIRTRTPVPPGTSIPVALELPALVRPLRVVARVVYIRKLEPAAHGQELAGMGVAFEPLEAEDRQTLLEYLSRFGR